MTIRRLLLVAGLAAGLAAPMPGNAADGPLAQTRATLEQTRVIIDRDTTHDRKLAELAALLAGFLDTDTMGKTALDKHWGAFTAAQQREFLVLFRELFQRTYVQKLLLFERPDFGFVGEDLQGQDQARVDTTIITPRDDFAVTYRMRRQGTRWLATDIQIEDLSLTTNFRRQMDRLLTSGSPADLLDRMRRKYGPNGQGGDEP
ncbi:ABC transporter substrate-binding protein [bacterium]|nr:ABC transporter substrate-binding protein [bacterium]